MADHAPIPALNTASMKPRTGKSAHGPVRTRGENSKFDQELARHGTHRAANGKISDEETAAKADVQSGGKRRDDPQCSPNAASPSFPALNLLMSELLSAPPKAVTSDRPAENRQSSTSSNPDRARKVHDRPALRSTAQGNIPLTQETSPLVEPDSETAGRQPRSDGDGAASPNRTPFLKARSLESPSSPTMDIRSGEPEEAIQADRAPQLTAPASQVQEIRVAPACPAPAEQILEQISAPARTMLEQPLASRPVMKALTIELRPEGLGPVQVTLRLSGKAMEITIEPAGEEAESLLRSDSAMADEIARTVTEAGEVASVTIQIVSAQPDAANGNGRQSMADNGFDQSQERPSAQSGGSSGYGKENARHERDGTVQPGEDRPSLVPASAGIRVV